MKLRHSALATLGLALSLVHTATAQTALAPWFDSDGFYNRPGVELARATNDMTVCRVEASRLKTVRNTRTRVPPGSAAFTSTGAYDPVAAGAAIGIASIMFAIQDARYNGSIEQIEFRDCAVALGYRHYRMGESEREQANAQADNGFASLVAAEAPANGRLNTGEVERNYYSAEFAPTAYQNVVVRPPVEPTPIPTPEAIAAAQAANPGMIADYDAPLETPTPIVLGPIARLAPGELATPQDGMAIVVVGASQRSGSMQVPWAGDTFQFKRVTDNGDFLGLLQPNATFAASSHFNQQRRRDPTLAGAFADSRYSTYVIPVGRYVLSNMGALNACLSTITFEVREGDVAYLGDYVLRAPGLPTGAMFNPIGNINSGMDNRLRADLRVGIADNFAAAQAALQADEATKARLTRVAYQNGYRIPCDGQYIGRVANPDWPAFNPAQSAAIHDAMAQRVAEAAQQ